MTTLLFTLLVSLGFSLVLTVVARNLGIRCGALDEPGHRKVHDHPIPRTGGMAIFASFFLSLLVVGFLDTPVAAELEISRTILLVIAGGVICFGMGAVDDFRRLKPSVKFLFQIIAASAAYLGGVHITLFTIGGWTIQFGPLNYFVTIFWFLLFMNAVNLVDGLDGLAGGIVVFASLVMILLSVFNQEYFTAVIFTALAGSVLGFLRYNFNPASVFMGDAGSYFLGYTIAAMGIIGSVKSQVAPAMMIPVLALGVPIFDTLLSPIRRFFRGRKIFSPDDRHIHHRLQKMGFSTARAVWLLYGVTVTLCLAALLLVNMRDERAGLFLILLGLGAVIFVRKLGYFEYLGTDKFFGWLRDLTDDSGLSQHRRSFLNHQIEVSRASDMEELWQRLLAAGQYLRLDHIELKITRSHDNFAQRGAGGDEKFAYSSNGFNPDSFDGSRTLYVVLPLTHRKQVYGCLSVYKDLEKGEIFPFMLRRIEQVRRSVISALSGMAKDGG